ncbi:MAG TPA: PHB depolymerase family esterase [Rhodocyclaceae bacterium]|nr:PHB depolymerase family esterase [Rhodocyclaceae bacterium]
MNARMNAALMEAVRLTRAGQLEEATKVIQRTLRPVQETWSTPATSEADVIEGEFHVIDGAPCRKGAPEPGPQPRPRPGAKAKIFDKTPWPGVDLAALNESWRGFQGPLTTPQPARAPDPLPEGARFITETYRGAAGTRSYKLYVPSGYGAGPLPLVVMLHGCTQDPDDFAAGTRMNELAEQEPCLVLYPAQAQSANGSKCWNWFKTTDQQRDQGEPSIIAGMTRQVADTFSVDRRRIYIAGLSAGGAMAVTMGINYPDLYAAVGIHSGLPHAVAKDLPSALAAMRQGGTAPAGRQAKEFAGSQPLPVIVFHGDRDTTVHPCNGDQVITQCAACSSDPRPPADADVSVQRGQIPRGHAYTRTIYRPGSGRSVAEHWLVHGAGHAWSGGSSSGSYTDPKGPKASQEMLRFFLEHPRIEASA